MANYFLNDDGTTSLKRKNRKNGKNYIQQDDGSTIEEKYNEPKKTQLPKSKSKENEKFSFSNSIKNLGDTINNGAVKNHGLNLSNVITDIANINDARKDVAKSIPITGKIVQAADVLNKTAQNTATNMGSGALSTLEGVLDTANNLSDKTNNFLEYQINKISKGKKYADKNLKEEQDKQKKFIQRNLTDELKTKTGFNDEKFKENWEKDSLVKESNLGGQVAQGVGGMVPSLLAGQYLGIPSETPETSLKGMKFLDKTKTLAKNIGKEAISNLGGTSVLAGSTYGQSLQDAYNNGANEEQATKYAIGSTAKEIATEWITGGIPGLNGTGGLDKPVEKLIDKTTGKLKNEYGKAIAKSLMDYGYKFVGEGLEEGLSDIIDPYLKNATYSKDEKVNWEDVLNSFIVGGITGGILEAPNAVTEFNNNMHDAHKNTQNAKNSVVDVNSNQSNENNILSNQTENTSSDNNINQDINSQQNEIKPTLPIANNNLVNENNIQSQSNIEGNPLVENNNLVSLPLDNNTVERLNNFNKQYEKFDYVSSDNNKIDNFRKSANQFMNNSNESKSFAQVVEKVINDKGYNITLDNSIGDNVNGRININENGEVDIRINPNSDRAGEFVLTHEITHAIETSEMKNLVMDYASKNRDFNNNLENLKKIYNTEDVSDEVLADISGQLFGNQEFINNLSTNKPSIFKRIYDKIIDFANKITGNSKESLFIKDLKNKWEQAYRNSEKENMHDNIKNGEEKNSLIDMFKRKKVKDETLSDESIKEIEDKTKHNFKNRDDVKYVRTEDIAKIRGQREGYRTPEKVRELTNSIIANGITSPIELTKDNQGNIEIYNGNHRFDIANKLGLKEIPVVYTNDNINLANYSNINYNNEEAEYIRSNKNGNFKDTERIEEGDDKGESFTKYSINDNNISADGRTTQRNDKILNSNEEYNDRSSSNSTYRENIEQEGLDNSSFSLDKNAKQYDDLTKTNIIEYFRKDNGDVKVYLMDSNNNVLNEFSLWSDTNAIKELGEKLGNKIYETATDTNQKINIGNDIYNLGNDTDYFMNHRPSSDYGNASNFEENMSGVFEHPEWYMNMNDAYNRESLSALKKVQNNPEAEIKIYRATIGDKINPGDWITPSKKYAEYHNSHQLDGKGKVLEMTVKAKDILFAGDDINEFGYFPEKGKYSKKDGSWQEFVEKNFKTKGTRTYFEETNLKTDNTEKNIINKEKEKILNKYSSDKKINTKKITKEVSKILEFDNYNQKREFTDLISEYYDNPDLNKIKQDIKDKFSEKRIEYVNDYVKDIKKQIRETELNVPSYVKNNITDYAAFRKENFNKLRLKNQGQSIDSFYTELSESYPSVFSKEISNEVDQLERLSEFMKEDDKFYEKYNLDDNVINEAAQYVYDSIKNKDNIDDLINSISISPKQIRKEKIEEYREYAMNFTHNSANWIDKKLGLSYKVNTMKRNFYDVMGKKDGERLYHNYIEPIFQHNAQMQNDIDSYNKKVEKLNLNEKESIAVQMWGEYKYNPETLVTGPEIDDFITENKLDYSKIKNAAKEFRNIYDELIARENETLKSQGYKEKEYRKGYFPHFVEEHATSLFGKALEKTGWKINSNSIPTDIAGITDTFKPGKVWNRSSQQRKGRYTDFNVLQGYDNYIRGAMETIYFTEDIQKLRALENEIRYEHSEKGVQSQIDEVLSDTSIDPEERQEKIEKIYAKYTTPLNNLVSEIRDYTNGIANKKSVLDRTMEKALNRKVYSVMQNVTNRLSANMVGLNLSSAITNFIPITQAMGEVKNKYLLKGLTEAIKNQNISDGFENKSVFLTSRLNEADRLYKTKLDKISEKMNFMFDGIDSITANTITRAKYYENIESKKMTEFEAIRNADEFARDLMAGRSKGEIPTIFNAKNPLIKMFTSFQLEVANQYNYMLKDLPRDLKDDGMKKLLSAYIKMFIGAWIYNQVTEKFVGRKAAFSPADTLKEVFDTATDKNLKVKDKSANILENLTQDIPFVGGLIGGGRLPISSVANPLNVVKGESTVKDEAKKALYYTVLPFGGGQLKKTVEGASMYINNKKTKGSYSSKGQLRFEANKDPASVTQALLFGQYASKNAREYFDNSYSPLTDKQLKEVEEMNISVGKYRKYQNDKKEINKIKSDKNKGGKSINGRAAGKKSYLIMNSNFSKKEKNYLLSKIGNSKNSIKVSDLEQLPNNKKIYKFYFSLNNDSKKNFVDEIKNYNIKPEELYNYYSKRQKLRQEYTSGYAKKEMVNYIKNSNFDEKTKWHLYNKDYGSDSSKLLVNTFNIKTDDYFNTMEYADKISTDYPYKKQANIRKRKVFEYINNLKCSQKQKIVLFSRAGYSTSEFKKSMYTYINNLDLTQSEKEKIWKSLY